jgi:hypothetical protein
MESRALGRTDNRDCLGAWYDILKDPTLLYHWIVSYHWTWTRTRARQTRWWRRRLRIQIPTGLTRL